MKNEIMVAVVLNVEADSIREAEKMLDVWMRDAEDDERLIWYRVLANEAGVKPAS